MTKLNPATGVINMMILKWIPLALLAVVFTLLAILLSPILALLVKSDGYLPDWLSWYQTPDNPAIGDASFQQNQMAWVFRGITLSIPINLYWYKPIFVLHITFSKSFAQYLYALFWLARNPAYGFDHAIGAKIPVGFTYSSEGDEKTTNAPIHEGWVYREVNGYWQYYKVSQWSETKCWKINFGWKLWGKLEAGQVRQLVCTITPFAKVVP